MTGRAKRNQILLPILPAILQSDNVMSLASGLLTNETRRMASKGKSGISPGFLVNIKFSAQRGFTFRVLENIFDGSKFF